VVEIGTTKGDNKESILQRASDMQRLPDFINSEEIKESTEELPSF
jgi:hypothetical protein